VSFASESKWSWLLVVVLGCHAHGVDFDKPLHLKSGATARADDVTFTVKMMPKLLVAGTTPEIEQAQIDVTRGAEHTTLQVDTVNKTATFAGVVFELGYADPYHDDIELTVHHATRWPETFSKATPGTSAS
jgi:hypothetical protein